MEKSGQGINCLDLLKIRPSTTCPKTLKTNKTAVCVSVVILKRRNCFFF